MQLLKDDETIDIVVPFMERMCVGDKPVTQLPFLPFSHSAIIVSCESRSKERPITLQPMVSRMLDMEVLQNNTESNGKVVICPHAV